MSTATLEFYLADGGRHGMALVKSPPSDLGYAIHAREVIADHLDPLPLCWVAEGKRRPVPAIVEDWEVSFDHEALPSYVVIDAHPFVTCIDCKEWIHG